MKLFEFSGAETDWVAADDVQSARECLIRHYGITMDDVVSSYESVAECDPGTVLLDTDEVDAETEDAVTTTAAALMVGREHPFVVASTYS